MKAGKFMAIVAGLLIGIQAISWGQTKKDVIDAYNQGVKLLSSSRKGAIASFKKCISLADQVGEEASETRKLAEDQIPKLYYKLAVESYKKRDFEGAINGFEKTKKVAKKYGNDMLAQKSERITPKLYYAWGRQEYAKKNYEKALEIFDQGIQLNPNMASAYLGKALTYDKLREEDKMKEAADKAMETGLTTHDTKTVTAAEKFMRNYTYNHAVIAIQAKRKDEAEQYLKSSIEYGNNSPDVYYELGKIYQERKIYDRAITNIKKALSLDHGTDSIKARYYYIIGKIYEGENKKDEACAAFKKALYAPYDESAKYEIEHVLKCGK